MECMAEDGVRFDPAALLAALWAARRGTRVDSVRLASACAEAGARYANASQSLVALLTEIDGIEATLLEKLKQSAETAETAALRDALAATRDIHDCCARMRRAAAAGFAHAASVAARKRARAARHDIVNNIGTVRNALLLMEDEPDVAAREHFRAIAKRNSVSSEHLVRKHLSDEAACSGAQVALADDVVELITRELSTCADRGCGEAMTAALEELGALIGVQLERDATGDHLRAVASASGASSGRDQRHDLGRARKGDDSDALGL
jgi:hypothetical protein